MLKTNGFNIIVTAAASRMAVVAVRALCLRLTGNAPPTNRVLKV